MQAWHVSWSTDGRFPLCATEAVRREVVRTIARVAEAWLILFFLEDDHIHVLVYCPKRDLKGIVRRLVLALQLRTHAKLGTPHVMEVDSRAYLDWRADEYQFGQLSKHGGAGHPATWSGSPFADLVGARHLPGPSLRTPPRVQVGRGIAKNRTAWLGPQDRRRGESRQGTTGPAN